MNPKEKILLIEDERSAYSIKRYVSHLKQIENLNFHSIKIPRSTNIFFIAVYKYIILPIKVLFSNQSKILIPCERDAYLLWFFRGNIKIVTCHDLHTLMDKQLRFYHKCFYKLQISGFINSTKIVCVSKHTKDDLTRIYKKHEKKMVVIENAIEDHWNTTLKIHDSRTDKLKGKDFVLMVGTNAWYKNLKRAIDTIISVDIMFVKVGSLPSGLVELLKEKGKDFLHIEEVNDELLRWLYLNAKLFYMPSIHEGFGWPVLEAMSLGCPVVTSKKGSLPEVGGKAVQYTDPYDVNEMRFSINSLLKDLPLLNELAQKGIVRSQEFEMSFFKKRYNKLLIDNI